MRRSLFSGLWVILVVLTVGLLLAGMVFWLAGAPQIWLEVALGAGVSACCTAGALTGAFLLYDGLNRRHQRANRHSEVDWQLAQCGVGNYMLPAATTLVCLLGAAMILPHYREAWQMLQDGEMVFELLCPWLTGLGGFFFLLWLQSKRVFFGLAGLRLCRLLGKPVELSWPQVQKITLEQERGYPILVLTTEHKTLRFHSRTISDGWAALLAQTLKAAQQYGIPAQTWKQP